MANQANDTDDMEITREGIPPFSWFEHAVFNKYARVVGGQAWAIYTCLCAHEGGNHVNGIWVSFATIGEELGMDESTARRQYKKLVETGLIAVERRPGDTNRVKILRFESIPAQQEKIRSQAQDTPCKIPDPPTKCTESKPNPVQNTRGGPCKIPEVSGQIARRSISTDLDPLTQKDVVSNVVNISKDTISSISLSLPSNGSQPACACEGEVHVSDETEIDRETEKTFSEETSEKMIGISSNDRRSDVRRILLANDCEMPAHQWTEAAINNLATHTDEEIMRVISVARGKWRDGKLTANALSKHFDDLLAKWVPSTPRAARPVLSCQTTDIGTNYANIDGRIAAMCGFIDNTDDMRATWNGWTADQRSNYMATKQWANRAGGQ